MNSPPSETQAAVASVVDDVVKREGVDWADLAQSGLLGLAVPEELGGEGLGLLELAIVLERLGVAAVQLPAWETLVAGTLTVARSGTATQRAALLTGVAEGDTILSPALAEAGDALPDAPTTTVRRDGDTLLLRGTKVGVTYADAAASLLVLVSFDGGLAVALVDPRRDGVTLRPSRTSRGTTTHSIDFDDVPVELLGDIPAEAARHLRDNAVAGLALAGAGLLAGARDLTAGYVKERTQFGRALAEFQAVAQQIADVYVASRTLSLAAHNAAWRVAEGLDATDDLAVAAYWLAVEGPAALHTCHHLHGGTGVDITYPLHRYYSQITDLAHAVGGVDASLARITVEAPDAKNLELSVEQRGLKAELRDYFTNLASHEDHLDMMTDRHGATYQRTIKQMGQDGWMGVGWPQEYGGHGFGEIEQTIFANEAQRADVHLPAVTLQTVGPTLQAHGTQLQKDKFLTDILAGDVHFAIGYSEPEAGTDLASLRTTARLVEGDGDPYYLVNGQKIFTTGGHQADYIWLAVRTDPDAPKHKGISILIVDTQDPGYSWTPIITCDGSHHVNATYFNDVRVPADMLVGEENQGWGLITTQLNHERVMLGPAGRLEGLRDRVAAWATTHDVDDEPDVRRILGETTAAFRVNELLNWEVARAASGGAISVADASASKVFASDRVQQLGRRLAEIVHRYGDPADPDTDDLIGYLDAQAKRNLVLTFGGGVNEIQRELISMFGLGLPRVPR
ncbi:acyl-CoA dehydrogenase [Nocardioides jensenii]|uniref:acyl-CoA dehydrogenase n=1 Tax=Nocardioides jensenii TaxID=1843 RepID=UPI0008326727|nr:acyl-CoA dehydrogenase [Nocardioides jensenii]